MALVAETLVEEWLNRKGYFTIRGIKTGSGEIDLLAASFREPDGLHVEVTVFTNPIGYIGRNASGSYVKNRTPEVGLPRLHGLSAFKPQRILSF